MKVDCMLMSIACYVILKKFKKNAFAFNTYLAAYVCTVLSEQRVKINTSLAKKSLIWQKIASFAA